MLKLADELKNPYLEWFQIKLITADDPLAQDVAGLNHRYPGHPGFFYNTTNLGGMGIDGVYIYPASADASVRTI